MYDVEKAKAYALEKHGCQEHGCLTIEDHLTAVTEKAKAMYSSMGFVFNPLDQVLTVAWLHDIMEDTSVTRDDLIREFNIHTALFVWCVTDGEGKNRMERHLNTYYRTRQYDVPLYVKMCDRWHNQQRSIENGEKWAKMYSKEYIYFKFALYEPGFNDTLWAELDAQYEILKRMAYEK